MWGHCCSTFNALSHVVALLQHFQRSVASGGTFAAVQKMVKAVERMSGRLGCSGTACDAAQHVVHT